MADLQKAIEFVQSGTFDPQAALNLKWWEYYDRIILLNATAPGNYRFFSTPLGQGGKTLADTNWPVANQFPESEKQAVMYLNFYYIPYEIRTQAEYQKIIDLMKTAYFNLAVHNQPSVIQFPLAIAFATHMALNVTGAVAGDQILARQRINGCYELPIEIPLAAGTTITAEIVFGAATDADLDNDKIIFSMAGPKYNYK